MTESSRIPKKESTVHTDSEENTNSPLIHSKFKIKAKITTFQEQNKNPSIEKSAINAGKPQKQIQKMRQKIRHEKENRNRRNGRRKFEKVKEMSSLVWSLLWEEEWR